jgi:hypothetical protein
MNHQQSLNPYQSPSLEKLQAPPGYTWPFESDFVLKFGASIDRQQLEKCLRCDSSLVSGNRLAFAFVLFICLLFGAIVLIVRDKAFPREDVLLFPLPLGIIAACFFFPGMFIGWHHKRYWESFQWIWGDVHCEFQCEAFCWAANRNKVLLPWDSFAEILLCGDCLWFSSNTPWLIRLPIHRDWVDGGTWEKIMLLARAHSRFCSLSDSFRLRTGYSAASKITRQHCESAPDEFVAGDGQIAFRSPSSRAPYPSDVFQKTLTTFCFAPLAVFLVLFVVGQLHWIQVPGSQTLVHVLSRLSVLPLFIGFLPQLPPFIVYSLPFGSGFFGQTQACVNAQAGFISRESVRLSSPLNAIEIDVESIEKVDVNEIDVVVHLSQRYRKSLVIPLDQFAQRVDAIGMAQALRDAVHSREIVGN